MRRFIGSFARQTKGEWAGQTLALREWQSQLLDDLFALRPDGLRKHKTALIGLPRKNGKSTLCAALAIYGLIADREPGAEVYSCAGDRKQAEIVFGEAKRMVQADPELSTVIKVQRFHLEGPNNSIYRVLSADAALQQGLNPSMVIFDELHVQPNDDLWTAMTLGSQTRRQPLVIAITTAGFDEQSVCARLYEYGKKVQRGEIDDSTFFFRWWEPENRQCDYRDREAWAQANPMLGDTIPLSEFDRMVRSTPEFQVRRYLLNQWTAADREWLPAGTWDACKAPLLDLDASLPLAVGIDVGIKHDSSAVACAQVQGGRVVVRCKVWENPYPPTDKRHDDWKLNITEVENYLRELRARFPVPASEIDRAILPGPAFCYDPAFMERSAQLLEGEGLAMIEYPQTDQRMVPASQTLYQAVVEQRIAHDGDPALARHIGNVTPHDKPRGQRISKPKGSLRKIDAAVATAIAVHMALTGLIDPEAARSVYEDRGLLVL